ncbi:MAG TPA: sigma-70 family RNA polymerase sigma factor [Pirellulales bacterium]
MDSWITHALPGAVAYAASLLGNREKADDIVQECVCRLLLTAARYNLPRDGRRLLFRSITNACMNAISRERGEMSLDEVGRASTDGKWELQDAAAMVPPDLAIAEEMRKLVHLGLAALPVRQRSAIELWSFGYNTHEIADMLSLSGSNVRVIIHRARTAMAEFLRARGVQGTEGQE